MKKYSVNVHYDYCVPVVVEAENEDKALDLAKDIADNAPMEDLEFCDFTDACITGEKEIDCTKYRVTQIEWDTDGDEADLPTEVEFAFDDVNMDEDEIEETISDMLSDEYGYCHFGFHFEKL